MRCFNLSPASAWKTLAVPLNLAVCISSSLLLSCSDPDGHSGHNKREIAESPATAMQCVSSPDKPDVAPSIHCASVFSSVLDAQDILHSAYEYLDHIYYTVSEPPYKSFSKPIAITEAPEEIYNAKENRPKIVVDKKGGIYISWTKKQAGRFTGDIRFSYARNSGRQSDSLSQKIRFTKPITVNDDNKITGHRFDTLGISEQQDVYIAWIDKRDKDAAADNAFKGASLYYSVLKANSNSLSKNKKVIDHSCECCRMDLARNDDPSYPMTLMWRHIFTGDIRDHAIQKLGPEGIPRADTLTNNKNLPLRATYDEWMLQGCPHHGPQIDSVENSAEVDIVWFSNGSKNSGIYYSRWNWKTKSASPAVSIETASSAGHPDIATHKGVRYIAFLDQQSESQIKLVHDVPTNNTSRGAGSGGNSDSMPPVFSKAQTIFRVSGSLDYPQLVANDSTLLLLSKTENQMLVKPLYVDTNTASQAVEELTKDVYQSWYDAQNPLLVVFWAADCPPCLTDFEVIRALSKESKKIPNIVFVSTDTQHDKEEILEIIQDFGLTRYKHYSVSNLASLRAQFDGEWFGELPRHYVYKNGSRQAHSGRMGNALAQWF